MISNYVSVQEDNKPQKTWLLPLRKPVVDDEGHLRLGWWMGNEALRGDKIQLQDSARLFETANDNSTFSIQDSGLVYSDSEGLMLEGQIHVSAKSVSKHASVGFVFPETMESSTTVLLGVGAKEDRESHIGILNTATNKFESMDVTGDGCATVTGLEPDKKHRFRLLVRAGVFELYIDDLLMQTFRYSQGSGKIGFVAKGVDVKFENLSAWKMSLGAKTGWDVLPYTE